jgi:hypothetical protein
VKFWRQNSSNDELKNVAKKVWRIPPHLVIPLFRSISQKDDSTSEFFIFFAKKKISLLRFSQKKEKQNLHRFFRRF